MLSVSMSLSLLNLPHPLPFPHAAAARDSENRLALPMRGEGKAGGRGQGQALNHYLFMCKHFCVLSPTISPPMEYTGCFSAVSEKHGMQQQQAFFCYAFTAWLAMASSETSSL